MQLPWRQSLSSSTSMQSLLTDDGHPTNADNDDVRHLKQPKRENLKQFIARQRKNLLHFFFEDWCMSALLGIITSILSISVDVAIEYINNARLILYDFAFGYHHYAGLATWICFITIFVSLGAIICHVIAKQAIGSGIPEVKVIMHGFPLKNYLTFRTLVAKVLGLTVTLGGGLPVGKEGPFVHMGAIIANLLTRATSHCRYNAFFSNEGRQIEMLSSGCAVGIACTFSAPAGAVLYGIESTSKYFAVKNYWRAFFATTCSALIFRGAMAAIIPPHIGTIMAYYQTSFPTEAFLVEELPVFALLGVICGLLGSFFVFFHRRIAMFRRRNIVYKRIFGSNFLLFTSFTAAIVGLITYPAGFGRLIAGRLTMREAMAHMFVNCTLSANNDSVRACNLELLKHWTGLNQGDVSIFTSLALYFLVFYILVAVCVSLNVPAGIFVPSFVLGACMGRIVGESMAVLFPDGIRGVNGVQIYPGLYAVIGAAAYTGAVTHSLSIAVIVCELTGQLSPLLPVLIALMISNAISSFLQPSIYESIIKIRDYPHLADLPPSRISVHQVKVEEVMVRDVICLTRETTYRELRDLLAQSPGIRSFPLVTDMRKKYLLGSISRKYLTFLLNVYLGPDVSLAAGQQQQRSRRPSELLNSFRRTSSIHSMPSRLTDRELNGNILLANSPLHAPQDEYHSIHSQFSPLLHRADNQTNGDNHTLVQRGSLLHRAMQLDRILDLDEAAIDAAPFQLVLGTSLYKVHTLFSLLALSHAYVTNRGQLVGVVAVRELRQALNNIYSRGAVPVTVFRHNSRHSNRETVAEVGDQEAESGIGDRDDLDSGLS